MNSLKLLGFLSIITFTLFFVEGCKKDIEGCTDAQAVNYNPDATVTNGNCTYARDPFIGTFFGGMVCPIASVINNDSLTFTIEEKASGINDVRLLITLSGLPFILDGSVTNNFLNVSADLKNVPYTFLGNAITVNITASGTATMDAAGKKIEGNLSVNVKDAIAGFDIISDNCDITGTKQ